jgi:hypothetical protein
VPGQWQLKLNGRVGGLAVAGYVLDPASVTHRQPLTFSSAQAALKVMAPFHVGSVAQLTESVTRQITLPRYPAGTTAQTLVAAYQRYGWEPVRTMEALKALYLGQSQAKAFGVGHEEPEQGNGETQP